MDRFEVDFVICTSVDGHGFTVLYVKCGRFVVQYFLWHVTYTVGTTLGAVSSGVRPLALASTLYLFFMLYMLLPDPWYTAQHMR
jgi:hypothetical protein